MKFLFIKICDNVQNCFRTINFDHDLHSMAHLFLFPSFELYSLINPFNFPTASTRLHPSPSPYPVVPLDRKQDPATYTMCGYSARVRKPHRPQSNSSLIGSVYFIKRVTRSPLVFIGWSSRSQPYGNLHFHGEGLIPCLLEPCRKPTLACREYEIGIPPHLLPLPYSIPQVVIYEF